MHTIICGLCVRVLLSSPSTVTSVLSHTLCLHPSCLHFRTFLPPSLLPFLFPLSFIPSLPPSFLPFLPPFFFPPSIPQSFLHLLRLRNRRNWNARKWRRKPLSKNCTKSLRRKRRKRLRNPHTRKGECNTPLCYILPFLMLCSLHTQKEDVQETKEEREKAI